MTTMPNTMQESPSGTTLEPSVDLNESIYGLIDRQARAAPHQTAVLDGKTEIDYERLMQRAAAVAAELTRRGVQPGSLVGVCMDRTWELPATLVGVLRAGCAYVPLDPAYPQERVGYMVSHARLAAAVVDDAAKAELCGDVPALIELAGVEDPAEDVPSHRSQAGDLAYVIYTSGSTGRPKGVAVEHGAVVSLSRSMGTIFDADDLSGVLACASICFDASVMELLGTLTLGGKIVLVQNALELLDLQDSDQVKSIIMVPSALQTVLAAGRLPASVRSIVVGAEVLKRSLVEQIHAHDPRPRLINVYGPTEDTVYSTTVEVPVGVDTITIGRSVPGSRSYILDASLQPVADGVEGELYLAGDKLARGYLHDEQRTRERFLDVEPSDAVPETRLYKTGDLCRRRADGEIEFLGRLDQQVKIRGRRIELEEIESALEGMNGVDGAAAAAMDGNSGQPMLVGYVVSQDEAFTGEAARAYLSERLPGYMVPQVVMRLEALPRLPNDKLDRKGLPAPEALTCRAEDSMEASCGASPIERQAAMLSTVQTEIASILRLESPEQVEAHQLLDDLGIDSLTKVELSSRLGAKVDRKLPVSAVLKRSTPAALADYLLDVTGSGSPEAGLAEAPKADTLGSFQTQIQGCYPPFLAGKAAAWSATDKGTLVRELKELVSRPGDPFCKLVRTGSGARGVVADVDTDRVRDTLIWTTNLYLGLNRDPDVIAAARDAVEQFGTGMGTSAAASGITDAHVEFEQGFADLVGMESACLFPTGYTANVGAVAGLLGNQDVIVMDQLCHASIVDGARLCGATIRTFQHNNPADLEEVLKTEASPYRTVLVVIEGVYSMGEGAAPVAEIARTAKKYDALVLVDEAHSFGFYGPRGGGICAAQGATDQVDFIMTTLSKALGSLGGVVAASREHVALMKSSSRAFIFQASTSPADIAAANAALHRLSTDDGLRERLWDTTAYMRKRFAEAGYDLGTGDGPIVTPHFYDKEKLFAIVNGLFERGVHTSAVTYPIVESGRGRLRFICSAAHTREDVDKTLAALIEAEKEAEERLQSVAETQTDAGPGRADLEAWAKTFAVHLENTVAKAPVPTPDLAVSVGLGDDAEPITIVFEDRKVSVGGSAGDLPTCSLGLTDAASASALCDFDVQEVLDGMLRGTCALSGQAEPFIWFVGRLTEAQAGASA